MKQSTKLQIIEAIIALEEAHRKLTTLWVDAQEDEVMIDNALAANYPYTESFDELYQGVRDWKNSVLEILKTS